jgi:putative hemolysin
VLITSSTPATSRTSYPRFPAFLPDTELTEGAYALRFARHAGELDAVLRLRYEIFNLELAEGLDSSHATQRDEDAFDAQCHHVMVVEQTTGAVVGTYRMQTHEMARAGLGFYSAGEFDLSTLPATVLDDAVELGRACVAKDHRNIRVLLLLWRGLAAYLAHNHRRHLFGCCSLTSQDPAEGARVMRHLETHGHVHPAWRALPLPGLECVADASNAGSAKIPRLMKIYLTYGAKICSPPAIDRFFKTIDYLAIIDVNDLDPNTFRFFFR